jgi:hypothetical protein
MSRVLKMPRVTMKEGDESEQEELSLNEWERSEEYVERCGRSRELELMPQGGRTVQKIEGRLGRVH